LFRLHSPRAVTASVHTAGGRKLVSTRCAVGRTINGALNAVELDLDVVMESSRLTLRVLCPCRPSIRSDGAGGTSRSRNGSTVCAAGDGDCRGPSFNPASVVGSAGSSSAVLVAPSREGIAATIGERLSGDCFGSSCRPSGAPISAEFSGMIAASIGVADVGLAVSLRWYV